MLDPEDEGRFEKSATLYPTTKHNKLKRIFKYTSITRSVTDKYIYKFGPKKASFDYYRQ